MHGIALTTDIQQLKTHLSRGLLQCTLRLLQRLLGLLCLLLCLLRTCAACGQSVFKLLHTLAASSHQTLKLRSLLTDIDTVLFGVLTGHLSSCAFYHRTFYYLCVLLAVRFATRAFYYLCVLLPVRFAT